MPRTVGALVERQARQWQLARAQPPREPRRTLITVSYLHGAGGEEVVESVARELRLQVFDREIPHQIAEATHLSEEVVSTLDDKGRAVLAEWLDSFASHHSLSSAEYRYQLARVVGAVAQQGDAIVVGRGAHLVLAGEALRVLVVAPFDARVVRVMRRERVTQPLAERRVRSLDSERRAFLAMHFHAELDDPSWFDLVVNTESFGVEGAAATVRAAAALRAPGR